MRRAAEPRRGLRRGPRGAALAGRGPAGVHVRVARRAAAQEAPQGQGARARALGVRARGPRLWFLDKPRATSESHVSFDVHTHRTNRRRDRRQNIKRNNKFLVSVGLLKPPLDAARDDEHEWWYATGR